MHEEDRDHHDDVDERGVDDRVAHLQGRLEDGPEGRGGAHFGTLLEGLSGAFFEPLALSYALAVLASMVVALTVTPALSLILLPRGQLHRADPAVVQWLRRSYGAALTRALGRPVMAVLPVAVVAAAALVVVPLLGQSLLPNFKERDVITHWLAKPGTSGQEMVRITTQVAGELQALQGVQSAAGQIGQAAFADEIVNIDFAEN